MNDGKRVPGEINQRGFGNIAALHAAARQGHDECVRVLIAGGADIDMTTHGGLTSIHAAARAGNVAVVRMLCEASADLTIRMTAGGATPLHLAAASGQIECVRILIDAGAALEAQSDRGLTPLDAAAHVGAFDCAQLFTSYGARDDAAADCAILGGHRELRDWLKASTSWTPLHHLEVLTFERALDLLRDGANIHAAPAPSPLERAKEVVGEVSALVKLAARWSPESHHLFRKADRERAVAMLKVGYLLAWSPKYQGEAGALVDSWLTYVLPHLIVRS